MATGSIPAGSKAPSIPVQRPGGAAAQAAPRASPSIVAATVAGNALEFFDFTTYAFFAVYIGETFFPTHDPLVSVLLSVAVFGVGFITRPLGGLFIGAFADRVGRKPAMLLTIGLITVGTLGMALTPSYASIGMAAPLIVIACRLIQGFALGGEVGPSSSYLIEIAPPGRRDPFGLHQHVQRPFRCLDAADRFDFGAADGFMIGDDRQHFRRGARQLARIVALTAEQMRKVGGGLEMPVAAALDQFDTAPRVARRDRLQDRAHLARRQLVVEAPGNLARVERLVAGKDHRLYRAFAIVDLAHPWLAFR